MARLPDIHSVNGSELELSSRSHSHGMPDFRDHIYKDT